MSVEAITVVLHHSRAKGTAKLVLLGIANHAGDGGAWPTIRTLAKYANVSERSVQRAIEELEVLKEVRVHQQKGGLSEVAAHLRPNRYDVLVKCPNNCDRTTNHRTKDGYPQDDDDRVTPVSPGDASVTPSPDAGVTPPGDASVTQTVPTTVRTTRPTPSPASVTVPRASSNPHAERARRQLAANRHSATPGQVS